jgi:hypothetical protein
MSATTLETLMGKIKGDGISSNLYDVATAMMRVSEVVGDLWEEVAKLPDEWTSDHSEAIYGMEFAKLGRLVNLLKRVRENEGNPVPVAEIVEDGRQIIIGGYRSGGEVVVEKGSLVYTGKVWEAKMLMNGETGKLSELRRYEGDGHRFVRVDRYGEYMRVTCIEKGEWVTAFYEGPKIGEQECRLAQVNIAQVDDPEWLPDGSENKETVIKLVTGDGKTVEVPTKVRAGWFFRKIRRKDILDEGEMAKKLNGIGEWAVRVV